MIAIKTVHNFSDEFVALRKPARPVFGPVEEFTAQEKFVVPKSVRAIERPAFDWDAKLHG